MPDCVDTAYMNISDVVNSKLSVGVTYRPPGEDLSVFNDNYSKLLNKLSRCRSKSCIVTITSRY